MSLPLTQAGTPPSSHQDRRDRVVALAARLGRQWYDQEGRWVGATPALDARKTLWLSFGLLAGGPDEVALANTVLNRLEFQHHYPTRNAAEEAAPFDIFVTNHAVQALAGHRAKLVEPVLRKLEGWAREALSDYPGDRQADYQFHGFNDNMPAKATLGLILGGEYFGDLEAVEHGLWNLHQLKAQLTRRGLASEYTSPTYTPLTLVNLTEIARHARHAEARRLAADCAERLWADILGHFHPPTGIMGGPYARAYQLDSTGHFSTVACLLWLALGNRTAFDPIQELEREPMRLVHHHNDKPTQLGLLSWLASCPLEPPAYLLDWLDARTYPFHLHADAERGGDCVGEVRTTFYAEADFALGTAQGERWTELQSDACFLQYRRRAPLGDVADLRTFYVRYLLDGELPGDGEPDHLLKPHGPVHTVQKDRLALVLSRPSLTLAGTPVERLRLAAILPEHFGPVESVHVQDDHIFLRDGGMHLALRALNPTRWTDGPALSSESCPNYRLLSFENYHGPARTFRADELARMLNGFVLIVGRGEEESFADFQRRVRDAQLLDVTQNGIRTVAYRLGEDLLELCLHVANGRERYAAINGETVRATTWQADGMPAERLPFLGGALKTPPALPYPHQHLNVVHYPMPWQIAAAPGHSGSYPLISSDWDAA